MHLRAGATSTARSLSPIAGKQQGEYFQQTMNAQNRFAGWSYDAAGNLLNDGAHNYQFDAEGRIKCMDAGANCASPAARYVYSVEGRRVKRTVGASTTLYQHDGGAVLSEFANPSQGAGTWQKDYIYLNGALLATESATEGTRFHFSDHLGTPRVITDAAGAVLSRHDYYPYGMELTMWADGETHKFTGKERDPESGLDYFIARYYSSAQGRFLSPDWSLKPTAVPYAEFGNPQSLNLYAYVKNNPLNSNDPDGHDTQATLDPKEVQEAGYTIGNVIVGAAKGLWNAFASTVNLVNSQANGISNLVAGNDVAGYLPEAQYSNTTQAVAGTIAPLAVVARSALGETGAAAESTGARGASTATDATTLQGNRAAGNAFRDEIASSLKSAGREVKTEVTKQTPFGARRVDIEVSHNGKTLGGVETKSGNSRYLPSQRAKDAYLKQNGYPVNVVREPKP